MSYLKKELDDITRLAALGFSTVSISAIIQKPDFIEDLEIFPEVKQAYDTGYYELESKHRQVLVDMAEGGSTHAMELLQKLERKDYFKRLAEE